MNLRPLTISVLNNFKDINPKIVFNYGNGGYVSVASADRSIAGFFELSEEEKKIPEHGIYNLKMFLEVVKELSPMKDFSLDYKEKFVLIKAENTRVTYHYAPLNVITDSDKPPTKNKIENSTDLFSFIIKPEHLEKLRRVSSTMTIKNLQILVKSGGVRADLKDLKDDTSNIFSLILGTIKSDDQPPTTWNMDHWLVMPDVPYKATIMDVGGQRFSRFEAIDKDGKSIGLMYYIAVLAV